MKFKTVKERNRYFKASLKISGILYEDFAKKLGISRQYLYHIIHGLAPEPDINREINKFIKEQIQHAHDYLKLKPD